MHIRWTPAPAADLERISNYLKEHHPHYRQPTMRKLFEAIRSLKRWPHSGRSGREEGTRELLFPPLPYIAVQGMDPARAAPPRRRRRSAGISEPWVRK